MVSSLPRSLACLALFAAEAFAAGGVDYRNDVRPILAEHCYECHGPDAQKSGLRLDTVAAAREGGYNGAAVVAGNSGESLLIAAITGSGDVQKMPPERPPLSDAQIAVLKAWIDQGATAPADDAPAASKEAPTSTGRSSRSPPRLFPRLPTPLGCATRSMPSSWRDWKPKG